jgi:hypothetical protein
MKSKISIVMLLIMSLVMFGCSSNETNYVDHNPDSSSNSSSSELSGLSGLIRIPVLFGVVNGPFTEQQVKRTGGTSLLNVINTKDGSAIQIGDIGYRVNSIAYDFITNKLYGITSDMNNKVSGKYKNGISSHSQLIGISPASGAGTPITEITVDLDTAKTMLESIPGMSPILSIREAGFGSITFNSFGTLVAWTNIIYNDEWNEQSLAFFSTIDLKTGIATPFSFFYGGCYEGGIAFDNKDVLYLINRYYDPYIHTIDMSSGEVSSLLGVIDDTTYRQEYWNEGLNIGYYHGDFHPVTGKHWSIDLNSSYTDIARRNLFVVDINNLTIEDKIPTIDNLEAITFGYVDVTTLTLLGLTDLIDSWTTTGPE